jgi:cyclopropane fatty-acyl-phospholipid synthase-like methyltransferase
VNLNDYYGEEYYEIPQDLEELAKRSEIERYKVDIVMRGKKEGRLLEIGSSYGSFAYLAKEAGYDVTCIEMDADCCVFLNEVVKVKAIDSGEITEAMESLGEFDIIVLWHVIEHVPEPWTMLETLSSHLSPNGILVISTPNPDSIQFKLFQARWVHLDAPRHIQLIPLNLLKEMLAEAGLNFVHSISDDRGGLGWNIYGWRRSFENYGRGVLGKALSLFGKAVSILVSQVERRNHNGSTYTAIFRK